MSAIPKWFLVTLPEHRKNQYAIIRTVTETRKLYLPFKFVFSQHEGESKQQDDAEVTEEDPGRWHYVDYWGVTGCAETAPTIFISSC